MLLQMLWRQIAQRPPIEQPAPKIINKQIKTHMHHKHYDGHCILYVQYITTSVVFTDLVFG